VFVLSKIAYDSSRHVELSKSLGIDGKPQGEMVGEPRRGRRSTRRPKFMTGWALDFWHAGWSVAGKPSRRQTFEVFSQPTSGK
jgi:hypothetical protein